MYENVSKVTRNISEYPAWEIEDGLANSEYPYRKWDSNAGKYNYYNTMAAGREPNPFYEKTEEEFYETLIDFSEVPTDADMPLVAGKYAMLPDGSRLAGDYTDYRNIPEDIILEHATPTEVKAFIGEEGRTIRVSNSAPGANPECLVRRLATPAGELGLYQRYNAASSVITVNGTSTETSLTLTLTPAQFEMFMNAEAFQLVGQVYLGSSTVNLQANAANALQFFISSDIPETGSTTTSYIGFDVDNVGHRAIFTAGSTVTLRKLDDGDGEYLRLTITHSPETSPRFPRKFIPSVTYRTYWRFFYKNPQNTTDFNGKFYLYSDDSDSINWDLCDYDENILSSGSTGWDPSSVDDQGYVYAPVSSYEFEAPEEPGGYLLRFENPGAGGYNYIPIELDTGYDSDGNYICAFKEVDGSPYLGQDISVDDYPVSGQLSGDEEEPWEEPEEEWEEPWEEPEE